jgi:SAM-dependent methyltransferase
MSASGPGRTWQDVWSERQLDSSRGSTLAQLMAADGLDTALGSVGEDSWRAFVRATAATLHLEPGSTVFEVGCGSGAFLYELDAMGCRVGGLDQSAALIDYARAAIPRGQFTVAGADNVDAIQPADVVVSCGVFLYFPTLTYARAVVEGMAARAGRAVAILDLADAARREEALAFRRQALGDRAYDQRYSGLEHLFFPRDWMAETLSSCGLTNVEVRDQAIAGYPNSAFRFNAFGFKPTSARGEPTP